MITVLEFQESIRVLKSNPLRSALSILGVVFGVASVVAMLAIGMGAEREIDSILSSLGANTLHFSSRPMTDADWARVVSQTTGLGDREANLVRELFPGAETVAVSHWDIIEANRDLPEPRPKIVGIDTADPTRVGAPVSHGRLFTELEMSRFHPVMLVGSELAERWHPGEPWKILKSRVRVNRAWFQVVGIIGETITSEKTTSSPKKTEESGAGIKEMQLEKSLLVPLRTGVARLGALPKLARYDKLVVTLPLEEDVIAAKRRLESLIFSRADDARVFDLVAAEELIAKKRETSRLFSYFLILVAMISLVVGGIGIANVMLASMVERIREVGLRRAVGATQHHILMQFLSEALTICFVGGLLGLVLGVGVAALAGAVMGWPLAFPWWGALLSIIIATAVGLVSGIYPARTASRISPIEALQGRV